VVKRNQRFLAPIANASGGMPRITVVSSARATPIGDSGSETRFDARRASWHHPSTLDSVSSSPDPDNRVDPEASAWLDS
jgi:hypothetical protein